MDAPYAIISIGNCRVAGREYLGWCGDTACSPIGIYPAVPSLSAKHIEAYVVSTSIQEVCA